MDVLLLLVGLLAAYQLFVPSSVFREVRADVKRRRQSSRDMAEKLAQLHDLTQPERQVLRPYVLGQAYECWQDPHAAVIQGLIARGILRPVPGQPGDGDAAAFSVAAWTRSYLISRPELLS